MSVQAARCPKCGAAIPAGAAEGLCPPCLLHGALRWAGAPPPDSGPDQEPVSASPAPRRCGGYELIEPIAEGGMGVVFRARQPGLDRIVALKMIRSGRLAGAEEVRRFLRESRLAARLDHPNIVPVHDVGEDAGQHYFTMKLVDGGSLAACGRMAPRRAALILAKVARAVHHAHQRGILHRDLKPSNILLDSAGEPMVTDFGLARLVQDPGDFTLTGSMLGTPSFMAPEQAGHGATVEATTASDVYGVGAVLYFLLAGQPPFQAGSHFDVLRRVVEEYPTPPSRRVAALPSEVQATATPGRASVATPRVDRDLDIICLKCLEKDPARRYASAAALAEELDRWLAGEPILARPVSPPERLGRWARRRPALATLAVATVLGAGAFVALLLVSQEQLRQERNYARSQEDSATRAAAQAATAARRAADEARRAESNAISARLQLYAADISLASQALADGNLGLARRALDAQRPGAGTPDWRGFEWFHLWHRSQGDPAIVLAGHTQAVTSVSASHDGRWWITTGKDNRTILWDAHRREAARVFPPADVARGLDEHFSMSPVFAASPEIAVQLASGVLRYDNAMARSRPGRPDEARTAALSRDGRWLAIGTLTGYVRVWSVEEGKLKWLVPTHRCRHLAFTPDGTRLIVGDAGSEGESRSGWVKVYDTTTHLAVRHFPEVTGAFALIDQDAALALARPEGGCEVRSFSDGALLRSWRTDTSGETIVAAPDHRALAVLGARKDEAVIVSPENGAVRGRVSHGGARLWAVSFSPDGRRFATAGADHAVRIWELETWREVACLRGHGDETLALAWSPDGAWLASGSQDHSVRLWRSDLPRPEPDHARLGRPAFVSDTGEWILGHEDRGGVFISSFRESEHQPLETVVSQITLGFDQRTNTFATLSRWSKDQAAAVHFWDTNGAATRPPVPLKPAPREWISVAPALDAGLIAFGDRDGIHVYDIRRGALRNEFPVEKSRVGRLTFSPDGSRLATFDWPRTVQVYDAANGKPLARWRAAETEVSTFTFSPDGRLLAAGGPDNQVAIFEAATGRPEVILRGHKADILALAFSPDGRTLASSSSSRSLKLWHVPTWRELATLPEERVVSFLAFSGDGTKLFAGEHRRMLRVFAAPAAP